MLGKSSESSVRLHFFPRNSYLVCHPQARPDRKSVLPAFFLPALIMFPGLRAVFPWQKAVQRAE
jgi:hypothetical protein